MVALTIINIITLFIIIIIIILLFFRLDFTYWNEKLQRKRILIKSTPNQT